VTLVLYVSCSALTLLSGWLEEHQLVETCATYSERFCLGDHHACSNVEEESPVKKSWISTTVTTHLTGLYPRRPGWTSTRRNILSLISYLCGYYTWSWIYFLHFLQSIASLLHICRVRQSFSLTSFQVFFGLPLGLTPSTSKSMHFSPKYSRPFLKHANAIWTCVTVPQ